VTRLHFVRHGETDWNRDGLIQGSSDVPLSERGHEQARVLTARLADLPIGAVYASDLRRAIETAQPIAETLGLELGTTPTLRERSFGANEGRVANEVAAERGTERGTGWTNVDERHPGGESIRELYARVARFLDELLQDAPATEIVLVTSGGPVCVATAHLAREPVDAVVWRAFENCSVTTVDVDVDSI
jgi:2,3-bisphosphoglycerate-dependent phosphoglycerate mutase